MTWLDWAHPDLLADNYHSGYYNIPAEVQPDLKYGIIWHSAAGFWSPPGYTPRSLMESRGNSWDATLMTDGEVWKHRPRPTFVSWHGGGPSANIALVGVEVEGTGPWTAAQKASILRVNVDTARYFGWSTVRLGMPAPDRSSQDSIRNTITAVGEGGLYEHRWVSFTTCPDNRDELPWLITETNKQLQEGMMLDPAKDQQTFNAMADVWAAQYKLHPKTDSGQVRQGSVPRTIANWINTLLDKNGGGSGYLKRGDKVELK